MGIDVADRQVSFWGTQLDARHRAIDKVKDLLLNRRTFSTHALGPRQFLKYHGIIRAFRPKLIYGFTSAIHEFAQFLQSEDLAADDIGIKGVLVTGEPLFTHQRETLKSVFRCPVCVQYGAEEFGPIAYECSEGSLHVMAENLYVEVEKSEDNVTTGDFLVTGLTNSIMPLIRYRIGDVGAVSSETCTCGRGLPIIAEISGRSVDFIRTPEGTIVHGINFDYLPKYFLQEIRQFQIVQTDIHTLQIGIARDHGFRADTMARFEERLREVVGNTIGLTFEFKESLQREATGKSRFVSTTLSPHISQFFVARM